MKKTYLCKKYILEPMITYYSKSNHVKKIITVFVLVISLSQSSLSQKISIEGIIRDSKDNSTLIGANIIEQGTANSTISDINGKFSIILESDTSTLNISYLGYNSKIVKVNSNRYIEITLERNIFDLPIITISAQMGMDRKTPIAISTVKSDQIEEKLGTQEFPEILKITPGVHANKQGGGWGDSEIWMRGFDNTNIAVMINGIPVNEAEDGDLYWSNWAGLSDIAMAIQTQRGIGSGMLSNPSIGGTINIITKGFEPQKGSSAEYAVGADGYNKVLFSTSSGLMDNGWCFNILGSKTWGNGYIQGGDFESYTYYINMSKSINENLLLNINFFGCSQEHYQRSAALSIAEWKRVKFLYSGNSHWTRYNPDYGFDNLGQRKSTAYNTYNKPILTINHTWQINDNSTLSTTAYASWGKGYGYSGNVNSTTYNWTAWQPVTNGLLNPNFITNQGTFDYGMIYDINTEAQYGSELVMAQNIGDKNTNGLISTFNTNLSEYLDLYVGIDYRYFKGIHTNKIIDLYGGDYYIDPNRRNVLIENNYIASSEEWVNEKLGIGDIVFRDYDSYVMQEGIFTQLEYSKDKITAFVSGNINYNHYWRYDRFYYAEQNAQSDTQNFWGGNIKSGINYNINKRNNIFFNAGYISRAPMFKGGVFMSANNSNAINKDAKNQKAASAEIGYGFKNKYLAININSYFTEWIDKTMTKTGRLANGEYYYMNMLGVNARHIGVELDIKSKPCNWLELSTMLSLGDWKWNSSDVKGWAYDVYGNAITPEGEITTPGADNHAYAIIDTKGINVGGSAQTTASFDICFIPFDNLRIGMNYILYDRNYAYYSFSGGNLSLGEEMKLSQPWEIPTQGYLDLRMAYNFNVGKTNMTLIATINNVLNSYNIEKAWNPTNVGPENIEVNPDDVQVFYSFGRIWSIKLKIEL
jgi:hypothetical protein